MPANRSIVLFIALILTTVVCAGALNEELLEAARKGNVEAVKALLEKGAEVNAKSRYGQTPLYFAAGNGHLEVVKLLLERGADINAKETFYRSTPLGWAAMKDHPAIVKLLLERGAEGRDSALLRGATLGHLEVFKAVLEKGGLKPETLSDALAAATKTKRQEIVELLKKAGAQPPPPADFQVDPEILKSYQGTYRNEQGAEFAISLKEGKLSADSPWGPLTLGAMDQTTFRSLEWDGLRVSFQVEKGQVIALIFKWEDENQVFKKVGAE